MADGRLAQDGAAWADWRVEAYLAHRPALARFLAARLGSAAEAEDALQDLYLKLHGSEPHGAPDAPLAYLYRAAATVALDRIRSRTRSGRRDADWVEAAETRVGAEAIVDQPAADEVLIARERLRTLAEAIRALPPQARRVFTRLKIEGASHAEVAAELGISRSAVEKHVAAAMRRLMAIREGP